MKYDNEPSNQLNEIHDMMLRSSRFISLSGLSGISAGIFAIAGTVLAIIVHGYHIPGFFPEEGSAGNYRNISSFVVSDALIMLLLAIASAIFFTTRKAKKKGLKVWDSTVKRLLINMFIPLITGGIFCLVLIYYDTAFLVPAATLVFYGLALINASKYTLYEIRFLGIIETILGLASAFMPIYYIIFWAVGFGLLHIIYGSYMFIKYEYSSR